jgi:predicted DNA-binding transcriptional regulator AlpA
MTDRLLTAAEVADLLGVPESWVARETRKAEAQGAGLPHLRIGRYRRYDQAAVLGWLEGQRGGTWRKHVPSPPESVR